MAKVFKYQGLPILAWLLLSTPYHLNTKIGNVKSFMKKERKI
jgi:hypothetical protein